MPKNRCYAYILPGENRYGIVMSWSECDKIVKGEPEARYKGFKNFEEAETWLQAGAIYGKENYFAKPLEKGIYFDSGTGSGKGVEISVTDEKGKDLLVEILPKSHINRYGKHWVFKDNATNNYGELLACKYAIQIAIKREVKKVFGDSKLVIDFWSKGRVARAGNSPEVIGLSKEIAKIREQFEMSGGSINHISGDRNPADLGFHK